MENVDYSKTKVIKQLNVPESITVIGCGGTGAWVCFFSAIAGVTQIEIFDDAIVTATSLSRLPFSPSELGIPKVDAVARLVKSIRPAIQIKTNQRLFEMGKDEKSLHNTVFNCSDSAEFAIKLSKYANDHELQHVFAPYCGISAGVFKSVPSSTKLKADGGSWVGGAALAASLAVTSAFSNSFEAVFDPMTVKLKAKDLKILSCGSL